MRIRRTPPPPAAANPEDDPYLAYLIWKQEQRATASPSLPTPTRWWWRRTPRIVNVNTPDASSGEAKQLKRPGFGGGSDLTEDESHGNPQDVPG